MFYFKFISIICICVCNLCFLGCNDESDSKSSLHFEIGEYHFRNFQPYTGKFCTYSLGKEVYNEYVDGRPAGLFKDGGTHTEYQKGKKNGKETYAYYINKVISISNYKDGLLDGEFVKYGDDGNIMIMGSYTRGERSGTWRYFSEVDGRELFHKRFVYPEEYLLALDAWKQGEKISAIELMTKAYDKKDPRAALKLIEFYNDGYGKNSNFKKSLEIFEEISNKKSTGATASFNRQDNDLLCEIGKIYLTGDATVAEDVRKAIRYFSLAASNEFGLGNFYLGRIYETGFKVPRDHELALKYFKNDRIDCLIMANLYSDGSKHGVSYQPGYSPERYFCDLLIYYGDQKLIFETLKHLEPLLYTDPTNELYLSTKAKLLLEMGKKNDCLKIVDNLSNEQLSIVKFKYKIYSELLERKEEANLCKKIITESYELPEPLKDVETVVFEKIILK